MRLLGIVLVSLGVLMLVVGAFNGFGSLFTWNGRHALSVVPLDAEGTMTHTLTPVPGRRYTLSVEVVFDRDDLSKGADGVTIVESKRPLVVRAKDRAGTPLAEVAGWLDPNEPPNVLYGQAAHESKRGPMPELSVVRLVGPFIASSPSPITIEVNLGADRVGHAKALARRLVIHDDAIPGNIRNAFIVASVGAALLLAGLVVTIVGWFRRRGGRRRVAKAAA